MSLSHVRLEFILPLRVCALESVYPVSQWVLSRTHWYQTAETPLDLVQEKGHTEQDADILSDLRASWDWIVVKQPCFPMALGSVLSFLWRRGAGQEAGGSI